MTWNLFRDITGDNAYEKYLAHVMTQHPNDVVISRKDFYKQELDRKWNGIRRCC